MKIAKRAATGFYGTMKRPLSGLAAALACLLTGCIAYPYPHTSPAGPEFRGRVFEAASGRAIPGATVKIEGKTGRGEISIEDGSFDITSGRNFHWLAWWSRKSPHGIPRGKSLSVLKIKAAGYKEVRLDFNREEVRRNHVEKTDSRPHGFLRHRTETVYTLKPIPLHRGR